MTGAGLRQNTAVYSAAPKATPACVIPRFSSSGAFIFCPFFLVHCKPGGISYAGEALCYQQRLMRHWYGLTLAKGLHPQENC